MPLEGAPELRRLLTRARDRAPQMLAAGLNTEAELIMTDAKRVTPVDIGTLRGSGTVLPPVINGTKVSVTLGFGGAASAYAMVQHEGYFNHVVGQRKFLEEPVIAAAPVLATHLTQHLRDLLR